MHPPDDGLPPSFPPPANDIGNAEMILISKRVSACLPIPHTVPKLTLHSKLLVGCVAALIYGGFANGLPYHFTHPLSDIIITVDQFIQFTYPLRNLSVVKVLFQVVRARICGRRSRQTDAI